MFIIYVLGCEVGLFKVLQIEKYLQNYYVKTLSALVCNWADFEQFFILCGQYITQWTRNLLEVCLIYLAYHQTSLCSVVSGRFFFSIPLENIRKPQVCDVFRRYRERIFVIYGLTCTDYPANIYLFKVNNKNTRKRCEKYVQS